MYKQIESEAVETDTDLSDENFDRPRYWSSGISQGWIYK